VNCIYLKVSCDCTKKIRLDFWYFCVIVCYTASVVNIDCCRDWYNDDSFVYQRGIREDLVASLYELNDLQFDLASRGYDLDTSWPAFSQ
jgi:hypothetical protein